MSLNKKASMLKAITNNQIHAKYILKMCVKMISEYLEPVSEQQQKWHVHISNMSSN